MTTPKKWFLSLARRIDLKNNLWIFSWYISSFGLSCFGRNLFTDKVSCFVALGTSIFLFSFLLLNGRNIVKQKQTAKRGALSLVIGYIFVYSYPVGNGFFIKKWTFWVGLAISLIAYFSLVLILFIRSKDKRLTFEK
jgi:hypothetical protein